MEEYLFVYGTLRKGAAHPLHRVLMRHALPAGLGYLSGKLYDLGPYPAAVTDPSGTSRVVGELYRLHRPDTLLPLLDQYEGCAADSPRPWEYHRAKVPVTLARGGQVEAWVYLYAQQLPEAGRIASGDYLEGLA